MSCTARPQGTPTRRAMAEGPPVLLPYSSKVAVMVSCSGFGLSFGRQVQCGSQTYGTSIGILDFESVLQQNEIDLAFLELTFLFEQSTECPHRCRTWGDLFVREHAELTEFRGDDFVILLGDRLESRKFFKDGTGYVTSARRAYRTDDKLTLHRLGFLPIWR